MERCSDNQWNYALCIVNIDAAAAVLILGIIMHIARIMHDIARCTPNNFNWSPENTKYHIKNGSQCTE